MSEPKNYLNNCIINYVEAKRNKSKPSPSSGNDEGSTKTNTPKKTEMENLPQEVLQLEDFQTPGQPEADCENSENFKTSESRGMQVLL